MVESSSALSLAVDPEVCGLILGIGTPGLAKK